MKAIYLLRHIAAFLLIAFAAAPAAFAQVAVVSDVTGAATATAGTAPGAPAAAARTLRKGDSVNQGDSINTRENTTMVLRFDDGQIVALTANSSFKIDNYTYNRAEPAKSNILFSLLDGGMRAITGLIGKAKPEQVAYRAGNATIGIRGTDVAVAVSGQRATVVVNSGSLVFTWGGRTIRIPAGQGAIVNAMGVVESKPASEVLAALRAQGSPTAQVIAAVMSTATSTELQRAINQAIKDAGLTSLPGNQSTSSSGNTTGQTGSNSSGSGGGGSVPCTSVSPIRTPVGCT